jgi:hypothetical protein
MLMQLEARNEAVGVMPSTYFGGASVRRVRAGTVAAGGAARAGDHLIRPAWFTLLLSLAVDK